MTNADRIRSYTDEEFAQFFQQYVECSDCPAYDQCEHDRDADRYDSCCAEALKWLKQEAKE